MTTEIQQLEKTLKECQEKLEALKNPKPKFDVGKWYKENGKRYPLWCFEEYKEGKTNPTKSFGFTANGKWDESEWRDMAGFGVVSPATPTEIESALIAEAKRRDYKVGMKIKTLHKCTLKEHTISEMSFSYSTKEDSLHIVAPHKEWEDGCSNPAVYKKGQWAEIIAEPKIEIGGYEVKFHGGDTMCSPSKYTSIDGHKFSKEFWQAAKTISEHSKAKIMVGCSKQFNVSLETINQILAKL